MVSYTYDWKYESIEFCSLNPYCSGQWSRTRHLENKMTTSLISVLILIVVDNGLVQLWEDVLKILIVSLNPYCSGQWSRT